MICSLIPHRYSLYMLFWLFFFAFFTCFSTHNVSAASVTCDSSNMTITSNYASICDISSLDLTTDWYFDVRFPVLNFQTNTNLEPSLSVSASCGYVFKCQTLFSMSPSRAPSVPFSYIANDHYSVNHQHYTYFRLNSADHWSTLSGFSIVISDSLSSGITPEGSLEITENGTYDVTSYSEAVVDVSAPPSTYHDDLANINHSITVCAAVVLVLYFFYCIYRLIIKNSGVH